jgi:heterodisulfide reductase subunit A-like polyferredoxin
MIEKDLRYIIDFDDFPAKRSPMPELEVDKRIDNLDEVELGMTQEDAQSEAQRCLSCRRCLGCALCLAACEPKAIVFEQEDESLELTVDDIIISSEACKYIPEGRKELGFEKLKNVVCVSQLETMLDDKGPFNGLVLRPFDGEIPEKIAIVIDDSINGDDGNFISYTLQVASNAMKKTDGLSVTLLAPEKSEIDATDGIAVKKADVEEVKENEETGNLMVSFVENGNKSEEEYNLVVLANKPEVLPEIKELQEKLQ